MVFCQATRYLAGAAFAAVLVLSPADAPPARGQTATSESSLKVAFIFNFLKFTLWPAAAFGTDRDPIVVCVAGGSDLDGPLDALRSRTVQNRTIAIRRKPAERGDGACHVTYYGSNVSAAIDDQRAAAGTVTIGDSPLFAKKGGMINFYRADGRLRFEINTQAAREGQIYFSADLLNLAKIIQTERG